MNHTNEGIANRYDHPWISAAYKNAKTEWPVGKRDTITSTLSEFFYMLYMVPSHVTKLFAMGIGINCIVGIISIVTTLYFVMKCISTACTTIKNELVTQMLQLLAPESAPNYLHRRYPTTLHKVLAVLFFSNFMWASSKEDVIEYFAAAYTGMKNELANQMLLLVATDCSNYLRRKYLSPLHKMAAIVFYSNFMWVASSVTSTEANAD